MHSCCRHQMHLQGMVSFLCPGWTPQTRWQRQHSSAGPSSTWTLTAQILRPVRCMHRVMKHILHGPPLFAAYPAGIDWALANQQSACTGVCKEQGRDESACFHCVQERHAAGRQQPHAVVWLWRVCRCHTFMQVPAVAVTWVSSAVASLQVQHLPGARLQCGPHGLDHGVWRRLHRGQPQVWGASTACCTSQGLHVKRPTMVSKGCPCAAAGAAGSMASPGARQARSTTSRTCLTTSSLAPICSSSNATPALPSWSSRCCLPTCAQTLGALSLALHR